jgi:hypothetical protein
MHSSTSKSPIGGRTDPLRPKQTGEGPWFQSTARIWEYLGGDALNPLSASPDQSLVRNICDEGPMPDAADAWHKPCDRDAGMSQYETRILLPEAAAPRRSP